MLFPRTLSHRVDLEELMTRHRPDCHLFLHPGDAPERAMDQREESEGHRGPR